MTLKDIKPGGYYYSYTKEELALLPPLPNTPLWQDLILNDKYEWDLSGKIESGLD